MQEQLNWSRGGAQSVPLCPACGSDQRDAKTYELRDNDGLLPDRWRMVRCLNCQSLWLDPRPDASSISAAYASYYTHDADMENLPDSGTDGFAWQLIHGYLNRRFGMQRQPANPLGHIIFSLIEPWRLKLDYYGRHLSRSSFPYPGSLLDVGCGNGSFLTRATAMGWQVMGCEPDPKAVAACNQLNLKVIEGDAFHPQLEDKKFDVITLSHVLEHVDEQAVLLKRLFDLLRPGGRIWMALPNPNSMGLSVYGKSWHALHPPFHLCIPSQKIVGTLLTKSGFSNVKFLRRGAHVRGVWNISQDLSLRENLPKRSDLKTALLRIKADLMATFSHRYGEETVVIALKPGSKND